MKSKSTLLEILKDKKTIISFLSLFVLIILSTEYPIYIFMQILNLIYIIYIFTEHFFKLNKYIIFIIFTLDILAFFMLKLSILSVIITTLAVSILIYKEKSNKVRNIVYFLSIYFLLKTIYTIIMLI